MIEIPFQYQAGFVGVITVYVILMDRTLAAIVGIPHPNSIEKIFLHKARVRLAGDLFNDQSEKKEGGVTSSWQRVDEDAFLNVVVGALPRPDCYSARIVAS